MADDKTRIVARDKEKSGANGTPAERPITFYCSNGHRISVAAKLAGKRGTCSKCGIALTIPLPGAAPSRPAEAGSPPEAAEPGPPTTVPERIEPEAPEVAVEATPAASPADDGEQLQQLFASVGEEGVPDEREGSSASVEPPVADHAGEAEPTVEAVLPAHPTAQLVARLWAEREHGGIVELHITGGSVILPEWYEPLWSRGTHGLFASQAADGTVTLTAVAWDSVQKVVVRQVQGLPDGMF